MNDVKLLNMIFVVEGKNDRERLMKLGIPYVVITDGTKVSRETLKHLQILEKKHTIVVLTDPDRAGREISAKLEAALLSPILLNVPKTLVISKKDIGIEYIPLDALRDLLAPYMQNQYVSSSNITYSALLSLKLAGPQSKARRRIMTEAFNLIYGPLKTMYIQLLLLDINYERIEQLLHE